jgi:hypothetical protein
MIRPALASLIGHWAGRSMRQDIGRVSLPKERITAGVPDGKMPIQRFWS